MTKISFVADYGPQTSVFAHQEKGGEAASVNDGGSKIGVSGIGGIRVGAHNPNMDKLLNAFTAKENVYQEVRRIVQSFDYK